MPTTKEDKYILLVEDDVFIQKAYQLKFTKENIRTEVVSNGKQAMELLETRKEKPSVIMLDLMLPFVSGFEILTKITTTKEWQHIPVIVLSNLSQETDIEKAKKMGARAFLVKADIKIDDVVKKVKEYL